jgi:hypothetical protein
MLTEQEKTTELMKAFEAHDADAVSEELFRQNRSYYTRALEDSYGAAITTEEAQRDADDLAALFRSAGRPDSETAKAVHGYLDRVYSLQEVHGIRTQEKDFDALRTFAADLYANGWRSDESDQFSVSYYMSTAETEYITSRLLELEEEQVEGEKAFRAKALPTLQAWAETVGNVGDFDLSACVCDRAAPGMQQNPFGPDGKGRAAWLFGTDQMFVDGYFYQYLLTDAGRLFCLYYDAPVAEELAPGVYTDIDLGSDVDYYRPVLAEEFFIRPDWDPDEEEFDLSCTTTSREKYESLAAANFLG